MALMASTLRPQIKALRSVLPKKLTGFGPLLLACLTSHTVTNSLSNTKHVLSLEEFLSGQSVIIAERRRGIGSKSKQLIKVALDFVSPLFTPERSSLLSLYNRCPYF